MNFNCIRYLPSTYEARREGNVFSLFVCLQGVPPGPVSGRGGTPGPGLGWGDGDTL